MAKRVISFELSSAGISKAIREVEKFKKDLIKACNELIRQLMQLGIDEAQTVLAFTTDGTGFLSDSIQMQSGWDEKNRVGRVRTDTPYAAFVEFGTGIIGAESEQSGFPHNGYVPDGRGHGMEGWWYYNMRDHRWHHTWGEPAKPFMYTAFTRIRDNAGRYAATVFARL